MAHSVFHLILLREWCCRQSVNIEIISIMDIVLAKLVYTDDIIYILQHSDIDDAFEISQYNHAITNS